MQNARNKSVNVIQANDINANIKNSLQSCTYSVQSNCAFIANAIVHNREAKHNKRHIIIFFSKFKNN